MVNRPKPSPTRLQKKEIETMEFLKKHPHPNIANYYGCVVQGSHITGICLERYVEDVYERVWLRKACNVDVDSVISQIRSALVHIHGLGLCHNDVSPQNIMFR